MENLNYRVFLTKPDKDFKPCEWTDKIHCDQVEPQPTRCAMCMFGYALFAADTMFNVAPFIPTQAISSVYAAIDKKFAATEAMMKFLGAVDPETLAWTMQHKPKEPDNEVGLA